MDNFTQDLKKIICLENNLLRPVVTIKVFHQKFGQRKLGQSVCCHYQSVLIIFVKELEGRIGGKSCKHEKMAPTLTNYENIAVTLCLMSIAILRRRLRDRARERSWLLRRKQRSAYNTLLKELHTEDPKFRNYFRMDKTTIQSILL